MIQARLRKTFAAGADSSGFTLDVEFRAAAGVTVLFGPSGSGKTLVLDSLAGFVRPDDGRILLDDAILFDGATGVHLPPRVRNCGYVFQNYALFPHMTLRENLAFAAERRPRLERHRRVNEMLERFRIADAAGRKPHEVSGGQRQRCSIARALIGAPRLLLLDEPAQGLDAPLRAEFYDTLRQVRADFKTPVLLVTHDLDECFELGEEMIVLHEGRIVQSGAPAEILDRPASVEVARLLGAFNLLPGQIRALDPGRSTSRVQIGDCEFDGSISLVAGDEAVCTIVNVRKKTPSAELTVTKICVPADDGGRFNLKIDGQTKPNAACGDTFGPVAVAPGQHQVSESAGAGTSLSDYTTTIGGACAPDGSITLAAGGSATCTITNVRKSAPPETGTLEIQKQCSPAGTTGEFQIEFDGHVFLLSCGESTGRVEVGIGHHQIGEVAVNDSTSIFATTIGGDCAADGSVTVSAGEHATCVVTNTLEAPIKPPKPPHICYKLAVTRRTVTVGRRVRVLARVHAGSRPVRGVRVYARGPGVFAVRTTGPRGTALFVLRLRRRGILQVSIRKPYACPKPPPHDVGIRGVQTPPVTG